ncbi:MAG: glycosyltransferase family 2 protein [Planctomycetota bacterium]|nr:glycosyltransferase family 2 protein [Planctomycetota bacterium]MDA1211944.1 glycosyltransferase family 2 protein [Planctomycetota bacterium]
MTAIENVPSSQESSNSADLGLLSIVVPVLNESESLSELYSEIEKACAGHEINYELIFIDDGSTDDSWMLIENLVRRDKRISALRFRRNFGKAAALTAGLQRGRGELFLMMDADLQDDPAEIPGMIAHLNSGYDVVNGWKKHRLDPWHKVYPSKVFNGLVGWLTGLKLHDHNCGLKLFRREVANEIKLYGELHRFIPVLAHARGFRVTEVAVHHRPRKHGHSKYGVRRFLRGFLDLLTVKFLTGFGQRPQHILGAFGLGFFLLGLCGVSYLGLLWLMMNVCGCIEKAPIGSRPLLAYSIASMLLGAQGITFGLMAELIVANTGQTTDTYSIAETYEHKVDSQ